MIKQKPKPSPDQSLFTGVHCESLLWAENRHDEALAALRALRIRPSRLERGTCQVSYDGYAKLRKAGLLIHQMSEE